jgi:anhydro-N-acetylmuramic acid kinase
MKHLEKLYIGVMSGTSLDAIDVVLCEIKDESIELLHSSEYPFDEDLKQDILTAINTDTTLKTIGEVDTRLGKLFAQAINTFLIQKKIDKTGIKAIGLHGQTLWHEPNTEFAFSMQLANASVITVDTGIKVVSDFRQKDIALGGQGAPFAPAFHQFLFSRLKGKICVLNIGGMANLSVLGETLVGYDTGCGNVLLDYWIGKHKGVSYDKDGEWAKTGKVNEKLLSYMLEEEYFSKKAPKSTGRELFNQSWLEEKLKNFKDIKAEDVQATLLLLSAKSIVNEVKKTSSDLLIVCGGGVNNKALMRAISDGLSDVEVVSSDECGVSSTFMEAMVFAWLAYKRVHKQKVHLKSVTGAREDSILGCIYE